MGIIAAVYFRTYFIETDSESMTKIDGIRFSAMGTEDLEWFLGIRNQVRQFLHNTDEFDLIQCKAWYAETPIMYFVVSANIDSKFERCGYFRVRKLDSIGMAEIGMDLDPRFQGRNIGFLAYKSFASYIREIYQINGLSLRVRADNERAVRLYERLGFENLGSYSVGGFLEYLMFTTATRLENLPT